MTETEQEEVGGEYQTSGLSRKLQQAAGSQSTTDRISTAQEAAQSALFKPLYRSVAHGVNRTPFV